MSRDTGTEAPESTSRKDDIMRFAGIDIGSKSHWVCVLDEAGKVVVRPTKHEEGAEGYDKLREHLGSPQQLLIAMEATGHYWKNLFAFLCAEGYAVAVLNPLRARRYAEEDLKRAKTDSIDAKGLACFAAEKRPEPMQLPEPMLEQLRELVRFRERLVRDLGDRVRQLHRLLDLCFPEFRKSVRTLDSALCTSILGSFPTAHALAQTTVRGLAKLRYDGQHKVGTPLARELLEAAKNSVAAHYGPVYDIECRTLCQDIERWRARLKQLDKDIERAVGQSLVGKLLTSIDGIGPNSAARILAEAGDPARFKNARAFSAYLGVIPGTKTSGKSRRNHFRLSPLGNAKLRRALWMPTTRAIKCNPWLAPYYQRLRNRGKPFKVALIASMHKLMLAVYSVAKNRKPFTPLQPQLQDTSAL